MLDIVIAQAKDTLDKTKRIVAEVLPLVKMIPSKSEQSAFVREVASRSDLSYEALWADLQTIENTEEKREQSTETKSSTIGIGELIVGACIWLEDKKDTRHDTFIDSVHAIVSQEKFQQYQEQVLKKHPSLLMRIESRFSDVSDLDRVLEELISRFELWVLERKLKENRILLGQAERNGQEETVEELLKNNHTMMMRIDSLKAGLTREDF
jgi:DNA primase